MESVIIDCNAEARMTKLEVRVKGVGMLGDEFSECMYVRLG